MKGYAGYALPCGRAAFNGDAHQPRCHKVASNRISDSKCDQTRTNDN